MILCHVKLRSLSRNMGIGGAGSNSKGLLCLHYMRWSGLCVAEARAEPMFRTSRRKSCAKRTFDVSKMERWAVMRNGRVSIFGFSLGVLLLGAVTGCRGPTWQVGPSLLVTSRQVREALRDPVWGIPEPPFNPTAAPLFDAPGKTRPCCPFGMDLRVKVGAATVPGYKKENIITIDDI